jgi:photosystem II stability/assembly factor-like uncharacterized protein
LRTDDGGLTWKDQESGVKINLYSVAAATRDEAMIVGEQGRVLSTRDGGETWELLPTVTSASLFAVAFRGGDAAWVAGRGGTILRRADTLATVKIPRPKIPPVLRGGQPKLTLQGQSDAVPVLDADDIPRAVPPALKAKP